MSELHAFVETYLIPAQLVLAMLGMGATLGVRDFVDVARDPRGLALGLALQLVFVPLVAFGFIEVLDLSPGWAVGLCLVAVVPGGAFSNLLTFLGRGNVPLSISVTVASTVGCIATVPLLLRVLAASYLPADFQFPIERIVIEIFSYLLVPLALGMVLYRFLERRALAVSTWSIRGSIGLLIIITISALQSGRMQILEYGALPPLRMVAFGVLLAVLTPQISRALRRCDEDTVALTCEVAVRNIGIALLLVRFYFPGQEAQGHVLYTCLFYAGMAGFLAIPIVLRHRAGKPVVPFRTPLPREPSGR